MAKRKKTTRKKRRKSSYIPVGRKGHVKRGCGKRNWRRGGNARWRCKVGKKRPYKTKKKKG